MAVHFSDTELASRRRAASLADDALLCRYHSGRRGLGEHGQLTREHAGVYRHYHACLMRTLLTGSAHPEHVEMHRAIHIILMNSDTRRAMTVGQTVRVTQAGHEVLSRLPLELVVK